MKSNRMSFPCQSSRSTADLNQLLGPLLSQLGYNRDPRLPLPQPRLFLVDLTDPAYLSPCYPQSHGLVSISDRYEEINADDGLIELFKKRKLSRTRMTDGDQSVSYRRAELMTGVRNPAQRDRGTEMMRPVRRDTSTQAIPLQDAQIQADVYKNVGTQAEERFRDRSIRVQTQRERTMELSYPRTVFGHPERYNHSRFNPPAVPNQTPPSLQQVFPNHQWRGLPGEGMPPLLWADQRNGISNTRGTYTTSRHSSRTLPVHHNAHHQVTFAPSSRESTGPSHDRNHPLSLSVRTGGKSKARRSRRGRSPSSEHTIDSELFYKPQTPEY